MFFSKCVHLVVLLSSLSFMSAIPLSPLGTDRTLFIESRDPEAQSGSGTWSLTKTKTSGMYVSYQPANWRDLHVPEQYLPGTASYLYLTFTQSTEKFTAVLRSSHTLSPATYAAPYLEHAEKAKYEKHFADIIQNTGSYPAITAEATKASRTKNQSLKVTILLKKGGKVIFDVPESKGIHYERGPQEYGKYGTFTSLLKESEPVVGKVES